MGNCATKPKVLKDSDEDLIPVERETTAPAEKGENNVPNREEEAAAAARRSEKGKEILIEDDEDEHSKRNSLSHLFHDNKTLEIGTEETRVVPTNNKTGASTEKLDTSALMASNVKAPTETCDVQNRNDLEVKIQVKTPETPKAKDAQVDFSEDWEVKFPEELEAKSFKKTSDEKSKLAPELSEVKVIKESEVPQVLEDKNIQQVSEVKSDEVKFAESELLKVSEVKSSEDLEIKVPKVFEVKSPESEVKTDQETSKVEILKEAEFVDAHEKIDKADQAQIHEDVKETKDKEIVLSKTDTEEEEEKKLSLEKKVKEPIGNK